MSTYICLELNAIAVDIGNTRIKAASFKHNLLIEHRYFEHSDLELLGNWIEETETLDLIYSSTAAKSLDILPYLPQSVHAIQLDEHTPLPIKIDYDHKHLGRDRIANAVAGNQKCPFASLVIDTGTCVTFDWTASGVFLGGGISPGLHMRLQAMHHFTGRLPLVKSPELGDLIGKNTREALHSGAFHGLVLEIQGVISAFKLRYPSGQVYLTGGDTKLLAGPIENDIFADPLLTLHGLHAILENLHA